ncbi:MAG: hypothetical protein WCI11_13920 [Candidatus Methylumidiphilus sp.]
MKDNDQSSNIGYEDDLWELESRQRSSRRIQQIFQIYAVSGVLTGLFALAYFFFRQIKIDLSPEDRTILLVAMSGFSVSIASVLALFLKKQAIALQIERKGYISSASEFLVLWAQFEIKGRNRLEAAGQKFNTMSIREIISRLIDTKYLTASDASTLEEILRFRNFLVHSGAQTSQDDLNRMTKAIQAIVNRLEV